MERERNRTKSQQVNHTSSITGLVHPEHRSQFPYESYISSNTGKFHLISFSDNIISFEGISSPMNNHRQQTYYNPQKHHSFQHPIPVQSVYLASPPVARSFVEFFILFLTLWIHLEAFRHLPNLFLRFRKVPFF